MEICHTQSIFPSSVIQTRDVSGFQMMEALYYANTKVSTHSHEQAVFCLALKGRCAEVYGSEVRDYRPLTVQFLPPNETHSLEISSLEVQAFSVEVAPQWFDRTREYSLFLDKSVHSRGGMLSRLFMALYKEFRQMDDASPLAVEGLALEMLAEVSRCQVKVSERKPPRWLAQALDLLREQFSEHLSVGHVATSVGVHPVHLARGFRRFCRCTIGEYIRQLRIEHACHELCKSDASLAAIATAAGFSDQSHFSRTFKRFMDMTPAEYRRTFSGR
jgi:AraC family transcriptional regulator